MSGAQSIVDGISGDLEAVGLILRGGLVDSPSLPELPAGRKAATLLLVGHAGSSHWARFSEWRRTDSGPDPLDRWTRSVVEPVASRFGATALYPFERPWWPFQRWIMEIEGLKPSPLGILIHPEYGLWHGYRAALAFEDRLDVAKPVVLAHACDDCVDRRCIPACPAHAFDDGMFVPEPCRNHLAVAAGQAGCMRSGCLARNACPVGRNYRYCDDELRFHMNALDLP
jgi:hypothetical protein